MNALTPAGCMVQRTRLQRKVWIILSQKMIQKNQNVEKF